MRELGAEPFAIAAVQQGGDERTGLSHGRPRGTVTNGCVCDDECGEVCDQDNGCVSDQESCGPQCADAPNALELVDVADLGLYGAAGPG